MPSYKDYELINESMRYMGNSFANTRQKNIENALRARALDTADRRTNIEDQRYTDANKLATQRLDEGQTEAWLTGEDGGTVQYRGNPRGLQALQDQAAAKGKPLKLIDEPKKRANIGSFRTVTPLGELTFNLETPADVDKVMGLAKQVGGQGHQPGGFNTAQSWNTEYQSKLEDAVKNATTPEEAALAARKLEIFKAQRPNPEDTETVTEKYPAIAEQPEIPGTPAHGIPFFKTPATPPIPAVIGSPERTVTRKVPLGAGIPPAAVPAPMPATPKSVNRRADGKIHVVNDKGQVGWQTVDPTNLPPGYQLAP